MRWIGTREPRTSKAARARKTRRKPAPPALRRAAKVIGTAAAFAIALGGPAWLWQSGWVADVADSLARRAAVALADAGLKVDQIYLHGRRFEDSQRIVAAMKIRRGEPILAVDLDAARARLEALAWVRTASVEREYPGTIRVRIVERKPLALWQRHNELVLVDQEGVVITRENLHRFSNLLVVVGRDAPVHATSLLSVLAREPDIGRRVNAAVRVGKRRWNVRMDNGVYVRLPETGVENAWARFARLERLHGLLKQDLVSIDLRIPDQLIVRTRSGRPEASGKSGPRTGKNT